MSDIEKEPGVTVYPISERQVTVRKAIANLARHGLRITGFKIHPETLSRIVEDDFTRVILLNSKDSPADIPKYPVTYCGIPIEQDANEPPPIS